MSEQQNSEMTEAQRAARDIAEVPAVEVITAAAVNLLSAAAIKCGLSDDPENETDLDEARKLIEPLLGQCRTHQRRTMADGRDAPLEAWAHPKAPLRADGALLVRFLATKGLEGSST